MILSETYRLHGLVRMFLNGKPSSGFSKGHMMGISQSFSPRIEPQGRVAHFREATLLAHLNLLSSVFLATFSKVIRTSKEQIMNPGSADWQLQLDEAPPNSIRSHPYNYLCIKNRIEKVVIKSPDTLHRV